MKHYSEFKKKIDGILEVSNTLKSLEKISASQVKIIKKKINHLDFYTNQILLLLNRLSFFYTDKENFFLNKKKEGQKILLVITGEKGLVGPLWQKIIDKTNIIKNNYQNILIVGKKGFKKTQEEKIKTQLFFTFSKKFSLEENTTLLNHKIIEKFKENKIKKIDILYAYSKSLSSQEVIIKQLLPFDFSIQKNNLENTKKEKLGFPIFTSRKKIIFNNLLTKYIQTFLYSIILNAKLSENASKTVEMEHAKKKSKIITQKIKNSFRRDKRKKINQEQLEKISAKK